MNSRLFHCGVAVFLALLLTASPSQAQTYLFSSGFDESNITANWDNDKADDFLFTDPGPFNISGNKVTRIRVPAGRGGAGFSKTFTQGYDILYARWYMKWEQGFDLTAANHGNGLSAGGNMSMIGADNRRPDNYAWAWFEQSVGNQHRPNLYAYYPGMMMDCGHPGPDNCYGDHFPCMGSASMCRWPKYNVTATPPVVVNQWYCIELMMKMGDAVPTADLANGAFSLWMDGVEYGPWPDLLLRTYASTGAKRFNVGLFHHGDHSVEGIMFDDVIVSTQRIGCGLRVGSGGINPATIPPRAEAHNPAPFATSVPVTTAISLHIRDNQEGVNPGSITMTINGAPVQPTIAGSGGDLLVSYLPAGGWMQGQQVDVVVDARDNATNAMPTERYHVTIAQDTIPATNFSLIKVNFQPEGVATPAGYLPDIGEVFGMRASGYRYGWDQNIMNDTRDRDNMGTALSTLNGVNIQSGSRTWELEVPNGQYTVLIRGVDLDYLSNRVSLEAEGVKVVDGSGLAGTEGQQLVTVSDGRLTIKSTPDSYISSTTGRGSNVINYVMIAEGDNDPTAIERERFRADLRQGSCLMECRVDGSIDYRVTHSGRVRIRAYDHAGRLVGNLVDDHRIPGQYRARWNMLNPRGTPIPKGVYVIRMESGESVDSKRIVLMR